MEEDIYYIHVNGEQRGPFSKEQLIAEGMSADTMVWRPGMTGWMEASSVPELAALLNSYSETIYNPHTPPQYDSRNPYQGYNNPYHGGQNNYNNYNSPARTPGSYPPGWTNWLGWAIVATILGIFCYFILCIPGIIGIVKANEANTMARTNDPRALATNSAAKTWTLIGLILSGIVILIAVFAAIMMGVIFTGFLEAME